MFSSSSKVWSAKEKIITGIQQLYHASQWLRPLRATCAESGQCLHYTVLLFLCDLSVTCLGESKSIWNGLFSSLSASQTLTLTSTPKTSSFGSGAGFESILTWAVIEKIKNKCVRTKCECSHGPDKARPHFFRSDISAFGSLQGKRLSTNPLTARDDDCLPVL